MKLPTICFVNRSRPGRLGVFIDSFEEHPGENMFVCFHTLALAEEFPRRLPNDDEGHGDRKLSVEARYQTNGNLVRFALGSYDHTKTLIIDPTLVYATYLGGQGPDWACWSPIS